LYNNIGERVKAIRDTKSLKQQEVADILKISRSQITSYETERRDLNDRTINDICREFHVNEEWLRTGKGEMFISSKKTTFEDFFDKHPIYKPFNNNLEAKYIFNNILSKDNNIIKMVSLSEHGKPALSACVNDIEEYYSSITNPNFELKDNYTKQALGTMVKAILKPFGYESKTQRDIPKYYNTKYIKSATVFQLTGKPVLKVEKRIVEA